MLETKMKGINIDSLSFYAYDKVYYIFGAGCSMIGNNEYGSCLSYDIPAGVYTTRCPPDNSALAAILKLWFGNQIPFTGQLFVPLVDDPFFIELLDEIMNLIKNNKKLLIQGHSFGGAILNRIAIDINRNYKNEEITKEQINNITFKTMGSIFIPNISLIQDINIENYLFLGDVAQRLNGRYEESPQNINKFKTCNYGKIEDKYEAYTKISEKKPNDSVIWLDAYLYDKENPSTEKEIRLVDFMKFKFYSDYVDPNQYTDYLGYLDSSKYLDFVSNIFTAPVNTLGSSVLNIAGKAFYIPGKVFEQIGKSIGGYPYEWIIHNSLYSDKISKYIFSNDKSKNIICN
jgi:hypothetical protein